MVTRGIIPMQVRFTRHVLNSHLGSKPPYLSCRMFALHLLSVVFASLTYELVYMLCALCLRWMHTNCGLLCTPSTTCSCPLKGAYCSSTARTSFGESLFTCGLTGLLLPNNLQFDQLGLLCPLVFVALVSEASVVPFALYPNPYWCVYACAEWLLWIGCWCNRTLVCCLNASGACCGGAAAVEPIDK